MILFNLLFLFYFCSGNLKHSYYQQQFIYLSSEEGSINMHQQKDKQYQQERKLYRPSDRQKHWVSKDTFDLRFPQIKNSMIDSGFCYLLYCMIRWRVNYTNQGIPSDMQKLNQELPVRKPTFPIDKNKITYTWIGHSTAVISFGEDGNFMIDPVFSERCSPVQFIGPKRFRPLPCTIDQLPRIDAVLVSHDHYDHLDDNALQSVHKRFPNCQFFAGLNSEDVFPKNCQMNTLDWTQQKQININGKIFKITFVPVNHWSKRRLFDTFYRLWGGFVIQSPSKKKVFYAGDTGYCGIFKQLGEVFGGFDLSILPIGAYLPRQFLRSQHIDPEEAVKIHFQTKSKKSVGVHWGTFPLGYEHYTAARRDLQETLQRQNLDPKCFITVDHGGHFQVDYL